MKSLICVSIILFSSMLLFPYPGGISGFTLKTNSSGCTSCHGSLSAVVQVVISGPTSLNPGQTGNYTVVITGGNGTGTGVDIAASNGTLLNSDTKLQVMNSELTHLAKGSYTSGSMTYSFKYTAPAVIGTQTLYATGVSKKNQWNFAGNFSVQVVNPTSVEPEIAAKDFILEQNYPNPFNPVTKISFYIANDSYVTLEVFNNLGEKVTDLINSNLSVGYHSVDFNAINLASGIYFYKLASENFSSLKKMVLMK